MASTKTIRVPEALWRRALEAQAQLAYLGHGICPKELRPEGHVALEYFFLVGVEQVEQWIRAVAGSRAKAKYARMKRKLGYVEHRKQRTGE